MLAMGALAWTNEKKPRSDRAKTRGDAKEIGTVTQSVGFSTTKIK